MIGSFMSLLSGDSLTFYEVTVAGSETQFHINCDARKWRVWQAEETLVHVLTNGFSPVITVYGPICFLNLYEVSHQPSPSV